MVPALCLAASTLLCSAPVAHADDTIRSQEYVQVMGLDVLKEEGLDGSGVTIAVIDDPIDTSVPELASADITTTNVCDVGLASPRHGTAVVSLLASPDYGWAPKATFHHYAVPTGPGPSFNAEFDELMRENCTGEHSSDLGAVVNSALDDGADVISISLGTYYETIGYELRLPYALLRASRLGVPVVIGSGNDGRDELTPQASVNGVVAVGATTLDGTTTDFSNQGPGLTIMAPGVDVALREPDASGALTTITTTGKGTSFATPLVTGALALAMQKWPEATGNQLVRSMLDTAGRANGVDAWDPHFGWGLVRAGDLVHTDPMSQPDSNPLLQKIPEGKPDAEMTANYWDGLVDPSFTPNDDDYFYRGTNESFALSDPQRSQLGTSPRFHGNGFDAAAFLAGKPQPTSPAGAAQSGASAQSGPGQSGPAGSGTAGRPLPRGVVAGGAAVVLVLAAGGGAALVRARRTRPQEEA